MTYIKILLYLFLMLPFLVFSQESKEETFEEKPERPAFESSYIIDNPSNVLFGGKTLEIQIKHRFGLVNGGENDLVGIWAPSNIRLGFSYAISDTWTLGFGTTKFDRLQDFSLKVGLLRQTSSGKIPANLTYYGNFTIDARKADNFEFAQDRFSFFHQVIIARRFGPNLSLQIAPSISHYNVVESRMRNDKVAIALGGRYKISPQTSILIDYSQPFTHHVGGVVLDNDPEPGFGIGVEFSTSGHAFQLFITNYSGIVPQKNYAFNQNDFVKGDFLIGFNITRAYRF